MSNNISDFAAGFVGGGIRPHLFEVKGEIGGVEGVASNSRFADKPFHIKAASLPASTLGIIEVPFRGRKIKIPGDRTFAEWSITILCTGDMNLRGGFEAWSNDINEHVQNTSGDHQPLSNAQAPSIFGLSEPLIFKDWSIRQLNRMGETVKDYTFVGCWPSEVGQIELDYETTDSVAEFPVTLQYSYWTTAGYAWYGHNDHIDL